MVDRVYKASVPELRKSLERLEIEFSGLGGKTDWRRLRVRPVLDHARALERLLRSRKFATELTRLRQGVELFHSDLVYLRLNVRALERLLDVERKTDMRRRARIARRPPRGDSGVQP